MIGSIAEFIAVWKQEAANTHALLSALTDESMSRSVTEEHRNIGRIAWHITTTLREMMERTGLRIEGPDPESPVPASAAEIARAYEQSSASLATALGAWTDASLSEQDDMYGEMWRRSFSLQVLLLHQTHHRGQLTVLMRQAGLPIIGLYGPTKDEWAKEGLPIPAV
jgi:uncharacterized damage-inducible protein DinB